MTQISVAYIQEKKWHFRIYRADVGNCNCSIFPVYCLQQPKTSLLSSHLDSICELLANLILFLQTSQPNQFIQAAILT